MRLEMMKRTPPVWKLFQSDQVIFTTKTPVETVEENLTPDLKQEVPTAMQKEDSKAPDDIIVIP